MRIFRGIVVIFLAISICSCVTNKGIYDPSVPEDQQCILEIPYSLRVKEIDSAKVSWHVPFWGSNWAGGKVIITIPSGKHTLVVDYMVTRTTNYSTNAYTWSQSDDITTEHEFLPNFYYKIVPTIVGSNIFISFAEQEN
jgi:hypothetical protein